MNTIRAYILSVCLVLVLLTVTKTVNAQKVYTITAYTADKRSCGKFADGYTATMHKLSPGDRVVAVDPKVIPLGSWVHIQGMGWYRALDVGGAIKGNKIDVWFLKHSDAIEFGRQSRAVRWQKSSPSRNELLAKN